MNASSLIQNILVFALPVLFAITVHEASHGYAARHFGDNTAAMLGRLTLNPLPHVDLVGTILMPLVLYFATSGAFLFGYAKPVPVNERNLRNPRRDMVWIALAGPVSNFVQALLWGFVLVGLAATGVTEQFFISMARAGIVVNLVMWAFNLFPLPPLDGGRVLAGLLPTRLSLAYGRIEPYGFFIVMALVVFHIIDDIWLRPLMDAGSRFIFGIMSPLAALLQ